MPAGELIGRESELASLAAMLADPAARLVTVTGPGGVGKTRLALAVSEVVAAELPGRVVRAYLAAIDDSPSWSRGPRSSAGARWRCS